MQGAFEIPHETQNCHHELWIHLLHVSPRLVDRASRDGQLAGGGGQSVRLRVGPRGHPRKKPTRPPAQRNVTIHEWRPVPLMDDSPWRSELVRWDDDRNCGCAAQVFPLNFDPVACPKRTVIAFEWDLCPTSTMKESGIPLREPPLLSAQPCLKERALAAVNLLTAAIFNMVVTNAGEGWVQTSRSAWMLVLLPSLECWRDRVRQSTVGATRLLRSNRIGNK